PLTSSTMDVLKIGLVSDRLDPRALRDFASWTMVPKLLAVPGVSRVNVFGGEVRQLQIQLRPEDLLAHRLAVADVSLAARRPTGVLRAGFVPTPHHRLVRRTEGQALPAAALGPGVLATGHPHARAPARAARRARAVAKGVGAGEPRCGGALNQGTPGVLLRLWSR